MTYMVFFLLATLAAAAIVQPLLPGSRATHPLPSVGRLVPAERSPRSATQQPGQKCPACGARAELGDQFCARCGGTLSKAPVVPGCALCGAPLGEGDRYCRKCGASVPDGGGK
jgi:predicted amidophosphoribosyltransferase